MQHFLHAKVLFSTDLHHLYLNVLKHDIGVFIPLFLQQLKYLAIFSYYPI